MTELSVAAHHRRGSDGPRCSKADVILHTFLFCRHHGVSGWAWGITLYHETVRDSDGWCDCHGQGEIWDSHPSRNLVLRDQLIHPQSQAAFTNKHQIRKIALLFGCCHCFPLLQMFVLQCSTFYWNIAEIRKHYWKRTIKNHISVMLLVCLNYKHNYERVSHSEIPAALGIECLMYNGAFVGKVQGLWHSLVKPLAVVTHSNL